MSGNNWIRSNEPISGNEVHPFVNAIVNGDFHDITNTGILLDEALAAGDLEVNVDGTGVSTATSWAGAHIYKIFLASDENNNRGVAGTKLPGGNYNDTIGICTSVTDDTQDKLHFAGHRSTTTTGSQIAASNNDKLYTLNGWKIKGNQLWPTWLSTNMVHSEDNHSLGMIHLDGGRNGTSVLKLSSNDTVGGVSYTNPTPNAGSYLYQEVDLDGKCWYDLHFRYSQTTVPSVDGIASQLDENAVTARLVYDIYDIETDSGHDRSLISGWQIADANALEPDTEVEGVNGGAGGSFINFSFTEQNSYYAHCNQYYDDLTDTIKFDYVRFYVPPRPAEADSVTTSIRFSMVIPSDGANLIDANHAVKLSYVSVKKAFPDLVTLSSGKNKLCPTRGLSRRYGLESHGDKFYDKWQNYELTFKLEKSFSEVKDWEIRIYGGSFGVTKSTKSAMITGITESGGTAQYTTSAAHGFSVGDRVTISGTTNFNDDKLSSGSITAKASTTFDLLVLNAGAGDENSLTANVELVNSSNYINTQSVGIKNIKLLSNDYKSGEQYSDHLLILPDNKTNSTSLTMYHTNENYWDTAFYFNESFKFSPVYSYINGLLQISDSDFANGNHSLIRWFYLDRQIFSDNGTAEYYNSFVTVDSVFPPIGEIGVTQEISPSLSGFEIDALKILGHTFATWEFWPKDDFTGFQGTDGGSVGDGSGNQPWHYNWFHHDQNYSVTPSLIPEITPYVANIPIKYVPENLADVWVDSSNSQGENFRHISSNNAGWQADGSLNWKTGGIPYSAHTNHDQMDDWEAGLGANQVVNNPIYIPVMGTNGILQPHYPSDHIFGDANKDMESALNSQMNYQVDATGLYIASLKIRLNLFIQASNFIQINLNGHTDIPGNNSNIHWTYDWNTFFRVPRIKIDVYKFQNASATALTNEDLTNLIVEQGAAGYLGTTIISSGTFGPTVAPGFYDGIGNYLASLTGDDTGDHLEYVGPNNRYMRARIPYDYTLTFNEDGENPSTITSNDNIILKISMINTYDDNLTPTNHWHHPLALIGQNDGNVGVNGSTPAEGWEGRDWTTNIGYKFSNFDITFYEPGVSAGDSFGSGTSSIGVNINFNFIGATDINEEGSDEFIGSTDSWVNRKFKVGISTVNHFDEESSVKSVDVTLGEDEAGAGGELLTIQPGQAPNVAVSIGKDIIRNPLHKKVKIYIKDTEQDIWYKQLTIDTKTAKIKSSTSGQEFTYVSDTSACYIFEVKAKDMLFFNEVDSYEAETLISQEDSESASNLTCTYKTSVHANNRLYVGNIYQNGRAYGDRMLKTPIGKYNIFPASNFIDVAIQDGDEITGLAYFKDKILQFKKRKVFVINISGDTEYLEDTFEHAGINKQCQVATTPHGICWANKSGCYIYDGEKIENLIDNKIGAESFQATGIAGTSNYWSITANNSPSVGYIAGTKKLIVTRNTGYSNKAQTLSMGSVNIEGFTYDFQSKGWTFLMNKLTCTPESTSTAYTGLLSNFVNNQEGDVLFYSVGASADPGSINAIYKWDDESTSATDNSDEDIFYLTTKDFDFGSPGVRKKIYKVYITFKSVQDSSHQDSEILVKYLTNGGTTRALFADSTNYSAAKGLFDSGGGTNWVIAELKPNTPGQANNVYSFQLQFLGKTSGTGDIPNKFEINDITIIYREKNIK